MFVLSYVSRYEAGDVRLVRENVAACDGRWRVITGSGEGGGEGEGVEGTYTTAKFEY